MRRASILIILLLTSTVGECHAQSQPKAAPSDLNALSFVSSATISPRVVVRDNRPVVEINLRRVIDNIPIPLHTLRFLAYEEIRQEIRFTDRQERSIAKQLELLEEFETTTKWDFHSYCLAVRNSAQEEMKDWIARIGDGCFADILAEKQQKRFQEIQMRFYTMGQNQHHPQFQKWFKERLKLTPAQIKSIDAAVEENLKDKLSLADVIHDLEKILDEQQHRQVQVLLGPFMELDQSAGLILAQTNTLVEFDDFEDEEDGFHQLLNGGVMMLPSGRLCNAAIFMERTPIYGEIPGWRFLYHQIMDGKMDWLELAEFQMEELAALRWTSERVSDDGGPRTILNYYGQDVRVPVFRKRPSPECSISEFRAWEQEWGKATRESEKKFGQAVQRILLPDQLNEIRFALAISRYPELGVYHLLAENLICTQELSKDQRDKITELAEKKRIELREAFARIEGQVRSILDDQQRAWFDDVYGEYCPLYPSPWSTVDFSIAGERAGDLNFIR